MENRCSCGVCPLCKLRAQLAEAQQQIEQLAGDVRACVADYNDAKKRAETLEKQLAEARAQVCWCCRENGCQPGCMCSAALERAAEEKQ